LLKSMKENPYILCFLKCYHHLHHVTNCEIKYVDQRVNENYNLDIFEIIVNISELSKELIHKKYWFLEDFNRC
jgi:hypothetical protein